MFSWDNIQQLLRIIMQIVSGYLVGKGTLTEDMAVQLTGAILSLAGVAWWVFWNKDREA